MQPEQTVAVPVGVTAVFRIQTWHITKDDVLIIERRTSADDHACGYYDPDYNLVVVSDEERNLRTDQVDPAMHAFVSAKIRAKWPTARITREDQ